MQTSVRQAQPTGRELIFRETELIVSKTDLKGIITYANPVFQRIAGYSEQELLGKPHNLVRHPEMPRCVFKLLWDTIKGGNEIFAYVVNLAKSGDHYWVFAHVTPSYDMQGRMIGYHSNRRAPFADALPKVKGLYAQLLQEERRHSNPRNAAEAGAQLLAKILKSSNLTYGQFVFSLSQQTRLDNSPASARQEIIQQTGADYEQSAGENGEWRREPAAAFR